MSVIDENTAVVSLLQYRNLDGTPYTGVVGDLSVCGATGASGDTGDTEVGEGAALPLDDSIYELFRLEGHSTLPNGLYFWSESANQWVQV